MTEHFAEWVNKKGYLLTLSRDEIDDLMDALKRIKRTLAEEVFTDLVIEYRRD